MSKWFSITQTRTAWVNDTPRVTVWLIADSKTQRVVKTCLDYDDAITTAARYRAYFKARDEGTSALRAWKQALHDEKAPKLDWDTDARTGNPEAIWSLDGYVCVATIKDDDYPFSGDAVRGTFTDDWQEGAIPNKARWYDWERGYFQTHHYTNNWDDMYYIPGAGTGPLSELRAYFSKQGMSRHVADCAARKMMQECMESDARAYENNYYVGVIVTVTSLDGQQAEDSLWGIECDPYESNNEAYWSECAMDCAREAIYELDKLPVG